MARSDLLVSLVRSGAAGDQVGFGETVEALIARSGRRTMASWPESWPRPSCGTFLGTFTKSKRATVARVTGFDESGT